MEGWLCLTLSPPLISQLQIASSLVEQNIWSGQLLGLRLFIHLGQLAQWAPWQVLSHHLPHDSLSLEMSGIEPRTFHIQSMWSATQLWPLPLFQMWNLRTMRPSLQLSFRYLQSAAPTGAALASRLPQDSWNGKRKAKCLSRQRWLEGGRWPWESRT